MPEAPPTDAIYYREKAALEFGEKKKLAGIEEGEKGARAGATRQEGAMGRQEPWTYKQNQWSANRGGLLESGINAQRRGRIGADYAAKRAAVQEGLQQNEGRFARERKEAPEQRGLQEGLGLSAAEERYKQRLLQESPTTAEEPAAPAGMTVVNGLTVPTGTRTVKAAARFRPPRAIKQFNQPRSRGY